MESKGFQHSLSLFRFKSMRKSHRHCHRSWCSQKNRLYDQSAKGQGQVFAEDGRLLATYSVQGMVRDFATNPASMKKGYERNSM